MSKLDEIRARNKSHEPCTAEVCGSKVCNAARDRDYLLTEVSKLQARLDTISTEPPWAPSTAWGTDLWGEVMSEPTEDHARQIAKHHGASVYSRAAMGAWVKEES